jgi:hypothetical protein
MTALLLEPRRIEPDPGERSPLLDALRSELSQLRGEVEARRRDNLELRQQAGYWKSMHARAVERLTALEQDNEHLRGEVARLNAQLFGQKSEKQSRKNRSNQLDGLDDDDPSAKTAKRSRKGSSTCPSARKSSNFPKHNGFVPAAANPGGNAATPKTPSKSRSRSRPTAACFAAAAIKPPVTAPAARRARRHYPPS